MSTTIHGELTADGNRIVLIAAGPVEEIAYAAKLLSTLTPLIKKSDPPGALLLPATWPAVVQLSATYGDAWQPGPRLHAWILEQAAARTKNLCNELTLPIPDGLTPWPHQVAGAQLIAATGRALIFDEPRCLYGDAEIAINRAGKGFTMRLRDLVARLNGDDAHLSGRRWDPAIPTFVQREVDGVVQLGRISAAWASGAKETFTVTTNTGRTIRASADHPFLTAKGWRRLAELVVGDLVHVRGGQATGAVRARKPSYVQVAGLPAHPFAHGANRRTSRYRVAKHRLVAEAHLNGLDYNVFVDKVRAGDVGKLEFLNPTLWAVHHRDHVSLNNELSNLQVLTHAEHHRLHAQAGKTRSVLFKVTTERVASIERFGVEETFDIEVDGDPHNFIADGFVVHNTGKTITTILGLAELQHRGKLAGPVFVICPASVVDPWLEAIEDWAPQWRAVAWSGTKRPQLIGDADVYVSSYELVVKDAKDTNPRRSPLIALDPRAVVVDECHMTKTPDSKRSLAVRRVARNAHAFVALSGTPITHHPANLWPTLMSFAPGAWPARERWVARYCLTVPGADYGETILGLHPGNEPEFRLTLLGQHRRAARADLGWAPKSYQVRTVELPEEYRRSYDEFEAQMLAELPDGQELSVMDTLSQLSFLRRLACSAADVEVTVEMVDDGMGGEREKRHVSLHHKWPSWKIDELIRILDERGGAPTVAFAVSKPLAMMAGDAAEKAGRRVGYVVGGQTRKRRTETRKAFQRGELDLVCATVGAGGVGITLNRAKDLVFIERPWSLVDSIQAEDRGVGDINAPGCHVIDILAANTIDTRVRAVLRERAGQLADLVGDPRIVAELLGGATVTRLHNRKAS